MLEVQDGTRGEVLGAGRLGVSYAESTTVPGEKSKAELDRMLSAADAARRFMGADDDRGVAFVVFEIVGRQVRIEVPLPKPADFAPKAGATYRTRTREHQQKAWEQGCRARWRALVLLIKAKLEAISLGLSTPEREFLADIFLPNGQRIHDALKEGIARAYIDGKMPPLLGEGAAA